MRKNLTDVEQETRQDLDMDQALRILVAGEAPEDVHRAAGKQFQRIKAQLVQNKDLPRRGSPPFRMFRLIPLAAAVLIVAGCWFLFASSSNLTWAEVRTNFREVPFFNATLYITQNPAEPAERVELWMAKDGRLRIHQAGRVYLADKGELLGVWDAASRKPIQVAELSALQRRDLHMDEALSLVDLFADMEAFSLDALLSHFGGQQSISPPLPNAEAAVSHDIEVFDVTNDVSPEWMRVWVLQDAGLPVRMRIWDPRDGDCTEMLFDYMREQPAEAFDPDALAAVILARQGNQSPLYALLREPGGQLLTPEDLFEAKGYHMPDVVEAGRTADGIVWIRSGHSENRTPQGVVFQGFGQLTDNVGQEYLHRFVSHQAGDDVGLEYFIPLDYADGYREPSLYVLTCCYQPDNPRDQADVIGTVALKEWKEEAPLPEPLGAGSQAQEALKAVIREWVYRENWDHVDRLLAAIPGEPEDDAMAFYREETRLKKWSLMGRDDEVLALASNLHGILSRMDPKDALQHSGVVEEYLTRLVEDGRREEAQRSLAAYRETFQNADEWSIGNRVFLDLVRQFREAGLGQEQIDALFGFSAWQLPRVQDYLKMFPQNGVTVEEDPRFDPWRAYARTVADYYSGRSLPDTVDFPELSPFDDDKPAYDMPLPGVAGYRIAPLGSTWDALVRSLALVRGADPELAQAAPPLQGKAINGLAVYPDNVEYAAAVEAFLERNAVRIETQEVPGEAWVARYDGRPLPCWRYVRPLTAGQLGSEPVTRGGGRMMNAKAILKNFEMALNQGSAGEKVVILDETGLPSVPGENQTWGSICLSYNYAFGKSDAATEKAKEWFKDNFGITFTKENRPLVALTLVTGS